MLHYARICLSRFLMIFKYPLEVIVCMKLRLAYMPYQLGIHVWCHKRSVLISSRRQATSCSITTPATNSAHTWTEVIQHMLPRTLCPPKIFKLYVVLIYTAPSLPYWPIGTPHIFPAISYFVYPIYLQYHQGTLCLVPNHDHRKPTTIPEIWRQLILVDIRESSSTFGTLNLQ